MGLMNVCNRKWWRNAAKQPLKLSSQRFSVLKMTVYEASHPNMETAMNLSMKKLLKKKFPAKV